MTAHLFLRVIPRPDLIPEYQRRMLAEIPGSQPTDIYIRSVEDVVLYERVRIVTRPA